MCLSRMDLLPPQVDNGLVEPPTGAGALSFAVWHERSAVTCWAIIHHMGLKTWQYLFKYGALHLRNTSFTCASGLCSHICYITSCCAYIACVHTPLCTFTSTCSMWEESAAPLSDISWCFSIIHHVPFCLFKSKCVSPWKQTVVSSSGC